MVCSVSAKCRNTNLTQLCGARQRYKKLNITRSPWRVCVPSKWRRWVWLKAIPCWRASTLTAAPPVFAARMLGVKTFLHESNTVPGRANRWLARVVDEWSAIDDRNFRARLKRPFPLMLDALAAEPQLKRYPFLAGAQATYPALLAELSRTANLPPQKSRGSRAR